MSACGLCGNKYCFKDIKLEHLVNCNGGSNDTNTNPTFHLIQVEKWLSNSKNEIKKYKTEAVERENELKNKLEEMKQESEESTKRMSEQLTEEFESMKKKANEELDIRQQVIKQEEQLLQKSKEVFNKEKEDMSQLHKQQQSIVKLDVGGSQYKTSVSNLTKYSGFFQSMFSGRYPIQKDADGAIFIDRDGSHFSFILNFFRDGDLPEGIPTLSLKLLLKEAEYYQLADLVDIIKQQLKKRSKIDIY